MKNLFSFGNMKVGKDTAIFNITPAFNCISEQLGLCNISNKCYAKKAEKLYRSVVLHRQYQEEFWNNTTAKQFVTILLSIIIAECRNIKYLRISESGDFKNQSDVNKLSEIANLLKGKLKVYTYTARKDLDFSNISDNLVINGSGFMIHNNFYVYRNESEIIDKYICKGNCLKCTLCKTAKNRNIGVKLH
jgi:hypothetical protein